MLVQGSVASSFSEHFPSKIMIQYGEEHKFEKVLYKTRPNFIRIND